MDVLPLYIVLMVFFPPVLWLLRRKADLALALSVALYAVTWEFELALPSYPSGSWFFNPYAWQLLFVFGAWCALGGAARMSRILDSRITIGLAAAYLLFAFARHAHLALSEDRFPDAGRCCNAGCTRSARPISTC